MQRLMLLFQAAISGVADWAADNGFDNTHNVVFSQQETSVQQLQRQYVLHRYV